MLHTTISKCLIINESYSKKNRKERKEVMECPYYKDYTRHCIEFFPRVVQYSDFSICESDIYQNCLAYYVLQKKFRCKYVRTCSEFLIQEHHWIIKHFAEDEKVKSLFRDSVDKYCSSEQNYVLCANYKLFEQGIKPPVELMPDGRKLRIRDILLKKELTLE